MDEDNLKPLTGSRVISTLAEVYEGAVGLICPLIRTEKKIDVMIARPNCQNNGLKREDKTVMD